MMILALVFAVGSIPIVWWSRRSLLHPTSHGFPRFFAFEAILALLVLNVPHWFATPLSPRQLASWLLLVLSVVLLVWGVVLLRRMGSTKPSEDESSMFEWEHTQGLVTTGVYRYVRHPMYSSLFFLTWGAFLKSVSITTAILAAVATLALLATAKAEESENVARFGQEYRDYMKRTPRFVPFLF